MKSKNTVFASKFVISLQKTEMSKKRVFIYVIISFTILLFIGFLPDASIIIPVEHANASDYNKASFWYYPWGKSVTHKGVDIFSPLGTKVIAPCDGLVLETASNALGGNYVLMLGAKWRLHYFAHLNATYTVPFSYVHKGEVIAALGNTGNAYGKAPHLHYAIYTMIPYLHQMDTCHQGIQKIWYINPIQLFGKD
jgi:murein DD-endopeptidase MepM/ murein hydrolase activator NlpD